MQRQVQLGVLLQRRGVSYEKKEHIGIGWYDDVRCEKTKDRQGERETDR